MSSPKEKAKELIARFDVKYQYELIAGKFPVSMHDSVIKECALICVDEILDLMINTFKWDEKHNGNIEYWQEVKTEIEKL